MTPLQCYKRRCVACQHPPDNNFSTASRSWTRWLHISPEQPRSCILQKLKRRKVQFVIHGTSKKTKSHTDWVTTYLGQELSVEMNVSSHCKLSVLGLTFTVFPPCLEAPSVHTQEAAKAFWELHGLKLQPYHPQIVLCTLILDDRNADFHQANKLCYLRTF